MSSDASWDVLRSEASDFINEHEGSAWIARLRAGADGEKLTGAELFDRMNPMRGRRRTEWLTDRYSAVFEHQAVRVVFFPTPFASIYARRILGEKFIVAGQSLPWLVELTAEIQIYGLAITMIDVDEETKLRLLQGLYDTGDAYFRSMLLAPQSPHVSPGRDVALRYATHESFKHPMQFLLLHELGHFHWGHVNERMAATDFTKLADLQGELQKQELDADNFAMYMMLQSENFTPIYHLFILLHHLSSYESIHGYSHLTHPPTSKRMTVLKDFIRNYPGPLSSLVEKLPCGHPFDRYLAPSEERAKHILDGISREFDVNEKKYYRFRDFIGEYSQKEAIVPRWKLQVLLDEDWSGAPDRA